MGESHLIGEMRFTTLGWWDGENSPDWRWKFARLGDGMVESDHIGDGNLPDWDINVVGFRQIDGRNSPDWSAMRQILPKLGVECCQVGVVTRLERSPHWKVGR